MKEVLKSLGKGIVVGVVVTAALEITLLTAYHLRGNLRTMNEQKQKGDKK